MQGRNAKCGEAQVLLDYLNSRPSNPFARLEARIPEVERRIRAELSGLLLEQQLAILQSIAEQPQSFYKAVLGSVRLFEIGSGLTNLKREYRHLLTAGWVEYDLRASQLSAVAYLWDVPSLKAIFDRGEPVWEVLLTNLGVGYEMKSAVKRMTYAICYGAGKEKVCTAACENGGDRDLALRFFELPQIVDLRAARKRKLDEIVRKRKAGEPIVAVTGECITERNPIRILAQLMQAIEFIVVYPAARIAMRHNVLTLWQHDGFSVGS